MKSAFLLADDPDLFELSARVVVSLGGVRHPTEPIAQLIDDEGKMITIYDYDYDHDDPDLEWEYKGGPFESPTGVQLPDMSIMRACFIECRWERLFVEIVRRIALASPGPTWVLDGNSAVWPATDVDPERVCL